MHSRICSRKDLTSNTFHGCSKMRSMILTELKHPLNLNARTSIRKKIRIMIKTKIKMEIETRVERRIRIKVSKSI